MPDDFVYTPIATANYNIASWQKLSSPTAPIYIYIEGDGHAFDGYGRPTSDPTPRSRMLRDMASRDMNPNVVYMARPCQFIMSDNCNITDWTSGRFSSRATDTMATAIRNVANGRPVILIGYSGGAMISGLVIEQNPDIDVKQWITISGVLNHHDWTEYFCDSPLTQSADLNRLPRVPQCHYVAESDIVVPRHLSQKWTNNNIIIVPDSTHNDFGDFDPDCNASDFVL
ncbi:MAG: hypothetical protein NC311_01495 [Muribaculaceae bacterium]|nr:hypothetical protein [Muribaculaceae bacterium]